MNIKYLTALLFSAALLSACDGDNDNDSPTVLLDSYILSSTSSVPEGIAFDEDERAFYAGSIQGASITRIHADGTESLFRAEDNRAGLGGIKIDGERGTLWVCARNVDGMDSRVWVFDLDSTDLLQEYFLTAITTNGDCNDLVLGEDGSAYVTDPSNPFLYKLDLDSGEGEVLATDPLFNDITNLGLGLNGIALSPEGDALIVAKFAPPALFKVSLPAGDTITPITLSGDSFPSPDGLAVIGGDVYSVSDNTVNRVRFTGPATADVVSVSQKSGLSTATVADGELYVIKSEVTNFVVNGGNDLNLPFEIFRVDLGVFVE